MVLHLLEKRHSLRQYDPARKISNEELLDLATAARLAPSCYNDQPWVFIFCRKEQEGEGWNKIFSTLVEFNQGWAASADLLIAVFARMTFLKNGKPNRWGPYDTGAAAMSIALEALHHGLMAHQMGGFDEEKLKAAFNTPKELIPFSVIAVGGEVMPDVLPAKDRLPLGENFFLGEFGRAILAK